MASIFVLFLAVGFIARQWWVGADGNQDALIGIDFKDSSVWLEQCKSRCSKIDIVCDESEDVSDASADGCTVHLMSDICRNNNLSSGSNSLDQIKQLFRRLESGSDLTGCILIHEIGHSCDINYEDPNRNEMCSEVGANQAQLACEKKIINNVCASNPANELCTSSCNSYKRMLPAIVWDACMCSGSSTVGGVDNAVCCSCLKECKDREYYKSLVPSYCGELSDQEIQGNCNQYSSNSTHDCGYYNEGVRDKSKQCETVDFEPQICDMGTEYFGQGIDSAQQIVDNSCANLAPPEGERIEYLRGIINVFKPTTCRDCTPEEHIGDIWCPENKCKTSVGYIKYSCIDSQCDQGATSPVNVTIRKGALSALGTSIAQAEELLKGVNVYAQREGSFYQGILNAPRKLLGTTDDSSQVLTNMTLGNWKIIAQKEGYKTVSQTISIVRGQPINLTLSMISDDTQPPPPPPALDKTLIISVKQQNGSAGYDGSGNYTYNTAISGATVKITKDGKNYTKITPTTGDVTFENLEAGVWNILVTKPGYAVSSTSPTTANVAYLTNQANIVMTPVTDPLSPVGGRLTIRSIDQVGSTTRNLDGTQVTISKGSITKTQTAGIDGTTQFIGLNEGTWIITGAKRDYHQEQPLSINLANTDKTADLLMDSSLKNISVVLKMQSGTPVANATVNLKGEGGTATKVTAANGAVIFGKIKVGAKTISLSKPGYALSLGQDTTIDLQEDTTKELTIQRSGSAIITIRGKLIGLIIPLSGATVMLCDKQLTDKTKTCWERKSNLLGKTTFTDMAPGNYYYNIYSKNYLSKTGTFTIPRDSVGRLNIVLIRR